MSDRDRLTSILRDAAEEAIDNGLPVLTYEGYADAVITAGWRPPPRVIIDPAELADLPQGTVILDALGVPRQLTANLWVGPATKAMAVQLPLPAAILNTPA